MKYKNIGNHPEELAGGRIAGQGMLVTLTAKEEADLHNKRLIDEGVLIPVPKSSKSEGGDE